MAFGKMNSYATTRGRTGFVELIISNELYEYTCKTFGVSELRGTPDDYLGTGQISVHLEKEGHYRFTPTSDGYRSIQVTRSIFPKIGKLEEFGTTPTNVDLGVEAQTLTFEIPEVSSRRKKFSRKKKRSARRRTTPAPAPTKKDMTFLDEDGNIYAVPFVVAQAVQRMLKPHEVR